MKFTKLDYCQYLLSTQVNYTLTTLADHLDSFSHDTINSYLKGEGLSPRLLSEQVEELMERDPEAYLIFDDTLLDKSYGPEIEPTRYRWSGNDKRPIRGIGGVLLDYVNPRTEHFWVIDYHIFDSYSDGKSKPDYAAEDVGIGRTPAVGVRSGIDGQLVATKELMVLIEQMGKIFYCPLKGDLQVDDSGGENPYRRVGLAWVE